MHVVKVTGLTPRERCYPILRYKRIQNRIVLDDLVRNYGLRYKKIIQRSAQFFNFKFYLRKVQISAATISLIQNKIGSNRDFLEV
jgi:hypothetical protein